MRVVSFHTESGSPDSPEWHAWRANGIGGSDAATIAFNGGLLPANEAAPWQKDYAGLIRAKREKLPPAPEHRMNPAMARGRALESSILCQVEERIGIPFQPAFGEMDEFPVIRSSFDGLTFDHEVVLEIKVGGKKVHEYAKRDDVIPYYRPQIAHQCLVSWGHPEGWSDQTTYFANYLADEGDLRIVEVPAKTDWLRRMAEGLLPLHRKFWQEVEEGRQFPAEILDAAREWRRIKALIEEEDAKLKKLRETLIGFAEGQGVPKLDVEGVTLTKSLRAGSVNYAQALKALGIDPQMLEPFRGQPSETWMVK